jgi:hypothetical protein
MLKLLAEDPGLAVQIYSSALVVLLQDNSTQINLTPGAMTALEIGTRLDFLADVRILLRS